MQAAYGLAIVAAILPFLGGCSSGSEGGPLALLRSRAEASFEVTAKVTYEARYEPASGAITSSTTTITQGPWGRRWDGTQEIGGQAVTGSFLDIEGQEYICLSPLEEPGFCFPSGGSDDGLAQVMAGFAFSYMETLRSSDQVELVETSTREVASLKADCFRVTVAEPDPSESDICFSAEGILLSLDVMSSGGGAAIVATDVDRDVRADDFALPYPVVEGPP